MAVYELAAAVKQRILQVDSETSPAASSPIASAAP
jgi:hypothetical protein